MRKRGQAAIQSLGLLFVTLMAGGFAIDTGIYFTVHQGMQNAADAAALAAVNELFTNTSQDAATKQTDATTAAQNISVENMGNNLANADVEFGFVDPATGDYDADTFTTASADPNFSGTGGYNAVRVIVQAGEGEANGPISAFFTQYLGFDGFTSQAQAVAIYGGSVDSASGLRPVYLCQTAWDEAVSNYGDPTIPEITFYGDAGVTWNPASFKQLAWTGINSSSHVFMSGWGGGKGNGGGGNGGGGNGGGGNGGGGSHSTTVVVGDYTIDTTASCGQIGAGNWGFADLSNNNGAPGANTVRGWWQNGFNGTVEVGEAYDSMPGNQIHAYADEIQDLIDNETIITIPLYSSTSGNGSNAEFTISAIAAFKITEFSSTGGSRYIRGKFQRMICSSNCDISDSSTVGGALTRIRLVH